MLKIAGVRGHPALRILIGGAVIAIGWARHGATSALIVGAVLVLWGIAAVLGLAGGAPGDAPRPGRRSR